MQIKVPELQDFTQECVPQYLGETKKKLLYTRFKEHLEYI